MNILNSVLSQVGGNENVANLAARVGLSPEHVQSAVAALSKFQGAPGDTAADAAADTGLPLGKVQDLLGQLGGEGGLGQIAALLQANGGGILSTLDRDGDGNPLNDIADLASSFFGKK